MSDEVLKVNGTWNGTPISIRGIWGKNDNWEGHKFTADECAKLFNGEIIEFEAISKKGTNYTCKGQLANQSYTDKEGNTYEYVGFSPIFEDKKDDSDRFTGTWNGKNVRIKKIWGKNEHWNGHEFTADEQAKLLNGETISFKAISKKGTEYKANGRLENKTFTDEKTGKEVEYVGFSLVFDNN